MGVLILSGIGEFCVGPEEACEKLELVGGGCKSLKRRMARGPCVVVWIAVFWGSGSLCKTWF